MSDKHNSPKRFTQIELDEAMRNFQKNIDPSVIQPNFDYKKFEQDARKRIDNAVASESKLLYFYLCLFVHSAADATHVARDG